MTLDVAARLAAGRPSVSNTQAYVSACHTVGYQHPDLTAHAAQVIEWYCGEDGLDLHALDADCALLRAAAVAADEALRVTHDGGAAVSAAWQGESGSVATDFIDRHCAAGAAVARALHAAADAYEALRDGLGRLVDEKVGAAVSIDDRRAGERPVWLAAATTVSGGGAGREEAVGIVTQQITPYVEADIRTGWLTEMRSATTSVAAAYENALRELNAVPAAYFDIPGAFGGPSVPPPDAVPAAAQTVPAAALPAVAPASFSPTPFGEPALDPVPAPASPMPETTVDQPLPPAPLAESPAGLGAAAPPAGLPTMPDAGGGMSGLVGQLADALGALFDGVPDSAAADDLPELDDPVEQDDDEDEPDDVIEKDAEDAVPEDVPTIEETADEGQPAEEPATPDAEPVDAMPAPPPPEPPPADPPPQPDEQTPCEIAADELAQVGQ
ncbi:hypothetical protein [Mycobacterium sp. RTGN5]|uniref:hypothetical protein n=1 Tax=Mycobacterium sp. RTGN5 TaxID=3016522 RepID=UPI0029C86DB2|nr:hypothetical protein [Mycobacterium sp. RTGN5]